MPADDMSRYAAIFLEEAHEQLDLLERCILRLEESADAETLQELFRAAHTLKGASRAMGFADIGDLTHAMEDVLDQLRREALALDVSVVDALLEGMDSLRRLVAEVARSGATATGTSGPTQRLRELVVGAAAGSPLQAAPTASPGLFSEPWPASALLAAADARRAGCSLWGLEVRLASDCVMPSVRGLMVLQALEQVGSVLLVDPSEEDIESERIADRLHVVVASAGTGDGIAAAARDVSEVVSARLTSLDREVDARLAELDGPSAAAPSAAQPGGQARPADTLEAPRAARAQPRTVRVDIVRLDNLLNLVGELVIDQTRIARAAATVRRRHADADGVEPLLEAVAHLGRTTTEIQEETLKARMLPVDTVFSRFPRMVRDLANRLDKEVDLVVLGRETELDRSVIEVIGDPLIHLLRNCLDHGIEPPREREDAGKPRRGTIWLRARHEENHIVIEVEDDGAGIDPASIRQAAIRKGLLSEQAADRLTDKECLGLIFASGLSTAAQVTDISGRGVGMDIVKSNLTRFGALLDVRSEKGRGTCFTVKLPLTLAIIRGLLVSVGSSVMAVPLSAVMETMRLPAANLHVVNQREVIAHRGETLPLVRLEPLLATAASAAAAAGAASVSVVVAGVGARRFGIVVDRFLGEQEIVVKPLGKLVGDVRGVAGAAILGDGRIALIVDVSGLLHIAVQERVSSHAA
ncbi:MAG: chemotaxis protein CheA [Chthonomonadales bacterium]|nr:chemotaxis protein CheA [Chthonomonadales bacterium]